MRQGRVVIAGAGTGGLAAAIEFARRGFSVTVLEKESEQEHSLRHNWSDAVETAALQRAGFEIPKIDGGSFHGELVESVPGRARLFEPHVIQPLYIFDPEYKVKTKTPVTFEYILTNRQVLREMQIEKAKAYGAVIRYACPIKALLGEVGGALQQIQVSGVVYENEGVPTELTADLVIDATGYASSLRTMLAAAEIGRPFSKAQLSKAFRTVRRHNGAVEPETFCDHYRYAAYGGYFWLHFHEEGIVDIGGGLPLNGEADVKEIVESMLRMYSGIDDKEIRGGGGIVHIGYSPDSLVAGGFAVLGDAAAQINPSNGCGVGGALDAARDLAEVFENAQDASIASLWGYNTRWFSGRGAHYAALFSVNRMLVSLTHADVEELMRKNILGGEMLNYNINGRFAPVTLSSIMKVLGLMIANRKLATKLMQANAAGAAMYKRCRAYPSQWSAEALESWIAAKNP